MEACWQLGEIPDRLALPDFLTATLHQAASAALPFVVTAHRDPERLGELDDLSEAWLSNHVARRASSLQGRSFWTAVTRAFLPDAPAAPQPGHHAPVFGFLLRRLGIGLATTASLFLHQHLRGLVSSAVRLGIVGPLEAQAIQFQISPTSTALAARAPGLTLEDLTQTAPLLEVCQASQDRLYSRLFQS